MRAILIDPETQTVREIEIARSYDAMMEAIGGFPERAGALSSGDTLHVDSNGFITAGNKYFDIGSHQNYAGRGLIIGAKPLSNALIAIAEVERIVTYPDEARLPPPRSTIFNNMNEALDYLSRAKKAADAVPLDKIRDTEIFILPTLKNVDDRIFGISESSFDDEEMWPHIEMFPKSGNAELIYAETLYAYRINSEGICWSVPSGVKAERLRAALMPGEPLRAALGRARMAALADSAIHAACNAVTDELDRLVV